MTEVTVTHEFLMSRYVTVSERALADRALAMHDGGELDVPVGGPGLGYTARAVPAADRVARDSPRCWARCSTSTRWSG